MQSIVTEHTNICAICGRPSECVHHLIFGNSLRRLADGDNLTLPLCNSCHNMAQHKICQIHENPSAEALSKMVGQLAWEKEYYRSDKSKDPARDEFRKRYGRSYL